MRGNSALEEQVEPFVGHDILAEFNVRVGFEKFPPFRCIIELRLGHQRGADSSALAQDPAILRGQLKLVEFDTDLATEIKAVQAARGREKSVVKQIGGRFARLREGPN